MQAYRVLSLATLMASCLFAQGPAAPTDFHADPKFQKQFHEASELSKHDREASFAADAWRKANKTAGGRCMECFVAIIRAEAKAGDAKRAIEAAKEMDAVAQTPADLFFARFYLGRMLMGTSGSTPKPAALSEAHAAFQSALSVQPNDAAALYSDGVVLARLGKDADAVQTFHQFLEHTGANNPLRLRVSHFEENPDLARHRMAPTLIVKTLAGKQFNLDAMGGKVVLIDFWATWCGPCKAELPHMQKLAQKYAEEPFEVISVSWDRDEAAWRAFVAEHNMTWNQYRDADHELSNAFSVEAIPHYFTIDSDGVLTAENVGSGSDIDGRIKKLLKRARESAPAAKSPAVSAPADQGAVSTWKSPGSTTSRALIDATHRAKE